MNFEKAPNKAIFKQNRAKSEFYPEKPFIFLPSQLYFFGDCPREAKSSWLVLFKNEKEFEREIRISSAIFFGIGLGLIVDEFGLLLTMEFDIKGGYLAPHSYYLMGIVSLIFLLSLILPKK